MNYLLEITVSDFDIKKKSLIMKILKEEFPGKWKFINNSIVLDRELYELDEEIEELVFNTSYLIWDLNKGYCTVNIILAEVADPESFCIPKEEYQKITQSETNETLNEDLGDGFKINSSGDTKSIN